ncbi:MAG: cupin domain-containing protein [Candidatus Latescibacteria bacterium]|nr:cupin domain-containing protein [Candidatus Latescibacterota bacterium]
MGFPVYDFRTDVRNVLVTSQIRSRFLRLEPGQGAQLHSHDLGHEVFLILAGRAEFTIDGEVAELAPGQMCIALADQVHSVRVVGDEPMTMYLSVTPHIQPTHTMQTPEGERLPLRFMPSSAYDVKVDTDVSVEELIDRYVGVAQALAEAARVNARIQHGMAAQLKKVLAEGDKDAATQARSTMWGALFTVYQKVYALGGVWNDLAPQVGETG